MKLYAIRFPTALDADLTREYLLTGISKIEKDKDSDTLKMFKNYEDAVKAAKYAASELKGKSKGKQYPIYTVEVEDKAKFKPTTYEVSKKEKLKAVSVPFDAFTPVSASLKHADAKKFAKEFDLTEEVTLKDRAKKAANKAKDTAKDVANNAANKAKDVANKAKDVAKDAANKAKDVAKDAADKAKSTFETVKKYFPVKTAVAVAATGVAGYGFYHFGGVNVAAPYVAAAAAKIGVALPSAMAVSAGVSLGAGLLATAVAAGLYYGISKAVSYFKSVYASHQRTPKQRYEDDMKAEMTAVKELEGKLDRKNKNDKGLLDRFADLVKHTPNHRFTKDGSNAARQPKHDKLCVLQFEHRKLAEVVAIKDAKERAKVETKVQSDITNKRFSA